MSSYAKQSRERARETAQKVVSKAAEDGKLSGKEFRKLTGGFLGSFGSGANNTYMANEIAQAVRKNPDLVIGKNATEATGVKMTKGGELVHRFPEARTANYGGNGGSVTFGGRADWDKGSAKWVQNSKGSYTYIGDLTPKQQQQPEEPTTQGEDPVVQPTTALTEARNIWDAGQGGSFGSIRFNPTGNAFGDPADHGNRATDDYVSRFIPQLNRQANLEAREIGETGGFHTGRFAGSVPELGDPREMYEYYGKKIR